MTQQDTMATDAQRSIESLAQRQSFVREEILVNLSPDHRCEVEKAFLGMNEDGTSVIAMAETLRNADPRCVFDLIQYVDQESSYTSVSADDSQFISFKLHADRLCVEYNPSLTMEEIQAVCCVGESSKSQRRQANGLGFKSVFTAAWRVSIRSGHYSFGLTHRKEDSGLGVLRPVWEDVKVDEDSELLDLDGRCLLFLNSILRINLVIHSETVAASSTITKTFINHSSEKTGQVLLETSTVHSGGKCRRVQRDHFYVSQIPIGDEVGPSQIGGHITLAFPTNAACEPIIEPQQFFSMFPTNLVGLNFIVDAPFETHANRQDLVIISLRNCDLLSRIPAAFISAILELPESSGLQYTWMRYLLANTQDSLNMQQIINEIRESVQTHSILRTGSGASLRRITDLRRLEDCHFDEESNPLFQDLPNELYLSKRYGLDDLDILCELGLQKLSSSDTVKLFAHNLQSWQSRFKEVGTTWHEKVAKLLCVACKDESSHVTEELRKLSMIPLSSGKWASAAEAIFLDEIEGLQIPDDVGIQLLHHKAGSNLELKRLFTYLGVQSASATQISELLVSRSHEEIGLESSVRHLHFLYLIQNTAIEAPSGVTALGIYDYGGARAKLRGSYIPDDELYGAKHLLGDDGVRQTGAVILHPKYLENIPPRQDSVSYEEWLHTTMGVRRDMALLNPNGQDFSSEFDFLTQHRTDKVLGFLGHVWPLHGKIVASSPNLVARLSSLEVPCLDSTESIMLKTAFLPLPELLDVGEKYLGLERPLFPFLRLSDVQQTEKWSFLTEVLRVTGSDDIKFRLRLLSAFSQLKDHSTIESSKVVELYLYINACNTTGEGAAMQHEIRTVFESQKLLYVPTNSESRSFVQPSACLWDAPQHMASCIALKPRYEEAFGQDTEAIANFFTETLQVRNTSVSDIITELELLSSHPNKLQSQLGDHVMDLYQRLQSLQDQSVTIAESFEENALIYVKTTKHDGWYRPSECLWAETTRARGKVAISQQYPELDELFVGKLGVQRVDFGQTQDAMIAETASPKKPSLDKVKELTWKLNHLLPLLGQVPSLEKLQEAYFLPVRMVDGRVVFHTCEDDFFINDNEELFQQFSGRVPFLDFSLEEVCGLRHFIAWAGLESKLVSNCVQTMSKIQSSYEHTISEVELSSKALGLVRIAKMFGSVRAHNNELGLYAMLRTSSVLESGSIYSTVKLMQGCVSHEVESSNADLHIEESGSSLTVFLAKDVVKRSICLHSTLPRRLATWLLGSNDLEDPSLGRVVGLIKSVLHCESSLIPSLLRIEVVPESTIVGLEPYPKTEANTKTITRPCTPVRSPMRPTTPTSVGSNSSPPELVFTPPGTDDSMRGYSMPSADMERTEAKDEEAECPLTPVPVQRKLFDSKVANMKLPDCVVGVMSVPDFAQTADQLADSLAKFTL